MAASAVFWDAASGPGGKAGLLASLRLSQDVLDNAQPVIDQQIQVGRVQLYRRLGGDAIDSIKLTAYNENGTTDAEVLRLTAHMAEALMLRLNLSRVLPMLWMDDSSETQEAWNEDAFSRQAVGLRESELRRLEAQLDQLLSMLEEQDIDADAGFETYLIEPDETFWAGQTTNYTRQTGSGSSAVLTNTARFLP